MASSVKSKYYNVRKKDLGLSREAACEKFGYRISKDRLEFIENKDCPTPDEVIIMSEVYNRPTLCHYYCTHNCSIGKRRFVEHNVEDLSQIALRLLDSLNDLEREKERMIDISADDKIKDDEISDLVKIEVVIEKLDSNLELLKVWLDSKLAVGDINRERYEELKKNAKLAVTRK